MMDKDTKTDTDGARTGTDGKAVAGGGLPVAGGETVDGEELVRVMDVEREGQTCTGDVEEVESMLDELRAAVFAAMEGTGEFLAVVRVRGMRRQEFDGLPDWQGW